jgi:hypothetical protein
MERVDKDDWRQLMSNNKKRSDQAGSAGNPGSRAGRTEDTQSQHSGVWPASGPHPDKPNVPYQGMASFGQGDRGADGYQDSGQSEIQSMPPDDETSGEAAGPGA